MEIAEADVRAISRSAKIDMMDAVEKGNPITPCYHSRNSCLEDYSPILFLNFEFEITP